MLYCLMKSLSKTALMVYAICPRIQAGKKAVFGSVHFQKSLELFEKLQDNTKRIAAESGLETFWIFDHKQQGRSFGEKYSNAFEELFKQGYGQIISIGNDIPGLSASHILQAQRELLNSPSVLGPAEDGGNYLIALSATTFDKASFANLPWNSEGLHQALKSHLQFRHGQNAQVAQLEYLIDIDDFTSFYDYIKKLKSGDFYRFIVRLLLSINTFAKEQKQFFEDLIISKDNPLRAPPTLL